MWNNAQRYSSALRVMSQPLSGPWQWLSCGHSSCPAGCCGEVVAVVPWRCSRRSRRERVEVSSLSPWWLTSTSFSLLSPRRCGQVRRLHLTSPVSVSLSPHTSCYSLDPPPSPASLRKGNYWTYWRNAMIIEHTGWFSDFILYGFLSVYSVIKF